MPLIRFDLYEGRSDEELKNLLDTAHSVMVEAFNTPARDRTKSSMSTGLHV